MIKQLTLFTILLISNQVLADNCSSQNTQSGCNGVSGCAFTISGSTCTNSCTGLSQTDCTNNTNSPYCSYTQGGCLNHTDCTTLTGQSNCSAVSTCLFTPANGTCASKDSLTSYCASLASSSSNCSNDPKCQFVASTYSCSYKSGQCASKLTTNDCNTSYCTQGSMSCYMAAPGKPNCNFQDSTSCIANHCKWLSNSTCGNECDAWSYPFNQQQCQNDVLCGVQLTCSDNSTQGNTACGAFKDATSCGNPGFCTGQTVPDQCIPKSTYCSSTTTSTSCDSTYCTFTPSTGQQDSCSKNFDCTSLKDSSTCGNKTGCSFTAAPSACSNLHASSCNTSDNQATCTGAGKFCAFSQQGTCAATNNSSGSPQNNSNSKTSGSILSTITTAGSLIAAIALL